MASYDSYFSVLALFILFRETIEASIICGVLLQFLNRVKPGLKRAVWWGVAGGVGVSIIFGIIFIVVFYTAQNNLFAGTNRDWFKGIISWIAALLITILGFAMLRFLGWEEKWKRKLHAELAKKLPDAAAAIKDPAVSTADAASTDSAGRSSDDAIIPQRESSASGAVPPQQQASSALAPMPTLTTTSSSSGADNASSPAKTAKADPAQADVEACAIVAADADRNSADPSTEHLVTTANGEVVDMSPPTRRESWKIWILVFTTVVREGIESVVFLGGLGNVKLTSIPLAAFVGITCGVLVGVFLFYTGRQVKHIKWLIITMAIVIFFMAAGQVVLGTDALMRAGMFGWCSLWLDERPWYMLPMYDWTHCCADVDPKGDEPTDVQNRMRFFALMRAIFGYQARGTPLTTISYCCYWGLVFIVIGYKWWRGSLLDADYKHKRQQKKLAKEAEKREEEEARRRAEEEAAGVASLEAGQAGEGEASGEGLELVAVGDVKVGLEPAAQQPEKAAS
ncbi:hypothetical protein GPECTOR_439g322 [Gonium pectorale]|uniref:Iron permease FTR1 n=1 Tax=Gonium pectorale TaxID=33097 RepID=A0A150FV50_GONPE|nr:hypothetical protein GPECTOR_439g322 [Gonium pectorale]|eukprot:KXZ41484.1 hypothetical protein GPECTOR_439g322 [Gonium pectorale]